MRVLLLGDSIMLSLYNNARTQIMEPGGRTIENLAASGHTAAQQLAVWLASSQRGDSGVDVAAIHVGINDTRTAVPVATTIANIAALRDDMRAQNPRMRTVLSTVFPARGHQDVAPRYFTHWIPLVAQLRAIASTFGAFVEGAQADADDGFGDFRQDSPWGPNDHLHPSTAGNREHAKYLRRGIDDALGLLSCSNLDHPLNVAVPGWRDSLGTSSNNGTSIVAGHRCPAC